MSESVSEGRIEKLEATVEYLVEENQDRQREIDTLEKEKQQQREENQQLESTVTELRSRLAEAEAQIQSNSDDIQDNTSTIEAETADVATDGGVSDMRVEVRGEKDMDNLWIGDFPIGKIVDSNNTRVKSVASEVEEIREGGVDTEESGKPRDLPDEWSPIAKARARDDYRENMSKSPKRALTIFENLYEWSAKLPNGNRAIYTADNLMNLINAALPEDEDEITAWNQVYRACEALEDLSDGHITYKETKKGKALIIDEESMPSLTVS